MASLFCNNRIVYLLLAPILLSICFMIFSDLLQQTPETYNVEDDTPRPEVKATQGKLRGIHLVTHHERKIFGFKGIPYAQPPVGNLRFKAPVPAEAWKGTFDASRETNRCPQVEGTAVVGDEDCLNLNIYTPRLPTNETSPLLPVILYTVGGAFKAGHYSHTRWGPYFLLDKDVVLVVPGYRLGVLGYLSTGDEVSPGNYALKDLVRALEWTQENVKYFGGDPNQVTLMGGSSGAVCVHLLALTASSKGLFHRFITQSGSAFFLPTYQPRSVTRERVMQLAEYFGCPTDSSTVIVNCLRTVNATQLIDTESLFDKWKGFPTVVWGPTVEPEIEGALLTETAANLYATGKIPDLPWLSSITRDEGVIYSLLFHLRPDLFEEFLDNVETILPLILQYENLVGDVTAYTNSLKSFYLNDLSASKTVLLNNFTQLVSDVLLIYPAYTGIQQQLQIHRKNTSYLSSFEYRGTFSYSYWFSGGSTKDYGVCHGDEILYLFENHNGLFGPSHHKMTETDWQMVDTMVQLWTSFVINGTPTVQDSKSSTIWEPYSTRKNYLRIGSDSETSIEMKHNFFENRMQFMEKLTAATSWKKLC